MTVAVRVLPGGQSSARHAHSKQDEFVFLIEGELVLVTDAGRETVGPGTPCIGFPAGTGMFKVGTFAFRQLASSTICGGAGHDTGIEDIQAG